MKSIRRLFRPSSVPNDCKSINCGVKGKSNLKTVKTDGNKMMWSSAKNIDIVNNDGEEEIDNEKNFTHRDTRRSSVVVSQKRGSGRRRSTLSNSSSISEASSEVSYSDNDDESKKRISPKEIFENISTRKENSWGFSDFCVSKIGQASLGRREIEVARREMKGFISLLTSFEHERPLEGSRIAGCTHITAQTAVLIEGLVKLGATVRWCACNIYSTQNEVAAALAESGISVFAWKGENEEEFWWTIDHCINSVHGSLDLILDEGGDLTERCFQEKYCDVLSSCKGIVVDSDSGVRRLYQLYKLNNVKCPAINITDSVMKSIFESYYFSKETVLDALKRSTDTMICGKIVLIIGYGSVGKGCSEALRGMSAQVLVSEIDPICAIQACMEGYKVVLTEEGLPLADIIITCTGTIGLLGYVEFSKMKDGCIVCNMGHSTSEINIKSLQTSGILWEHLRDDLDSVIFPSKTTVLLIAQGRQANLNCSTVPSIVFSVSASVQLLALVELYSAPGGRYSNQIYLVPKKYDELIAKHHMPIFGAKLNELTDKQAKSLGVSTSGPFKPSCYRY